jgi:hypothetical protein
MAADTTHRTIARLAVYLEDMYFPCSRREILERAEDNEAPDALLDAIEELPERSYWSIRDILAVISGGAQPTIASHKPSEAAATVVSRFERSGNPETHSSVPTPELAARTHAPALSPRP